MCSCTCSGGTTSGGAADISAGPRQQQWRLRACQSDVNVALMRCLSIGALPRTFTHMQSPPAAQPTGSNCTVQTSLLAFWGWQTGRCWLHVVDCSSPHTCSPFPLPLPSPQAPLLSWVVTQRRSHFQHSWFRSGYQISPLLFVCNGFCKRSSSSLMAQAMLSEAYIFPLPGSHQAARLHHHSLPHHSPLPTSLHSNISCSRILCLQNPASPGVFLIPGMFSEAYVIFSLGLTMSLWKS